MSFTCVIYRLLAVLAVLGFFPSGILADEKTHTYISGEFVTLYTNKVGPYSNPSEVYRYFSLPFCRPELQEGQAYKKKENTLGVLLQGNELTDSGIAIRFLQPVKNERLCSVRFDAKQARKMRRVIRQRYWYQMYLDELPVYGMVGEYLSEADAEEFSKKSSLPKEQAFIYTHKDFQISYNKNRIIETTLTSGGAVPVQEGIDIAFTYSVTWVPTETPFSKRFDKYLDSDFFEQKVHWIAIFNSVLLVIVFCGIVGLLLLRLLRKDMQRYREATEDLELNILLDDHGWRQLKNDVFRTHPHLSILCASVGIGVQIVFIAFLCFAFIGYNGTVYDRRGQLSILMLTTYSGTTIVASIVSGYLYKRYSDPTRIKAWKRVMIYTGLLLPCLFITVHLLLNIIAYIYDATTAATMTTATVCNLTLIWLLVQCPLTLLGTVIGRLLAKPGKYRHSLTLRPVPQTFIARNPMILALLAGLVPFLGVLMEVNYIFSSLWSHKFYYVYGFAFVNLVIYILLTLCSAIVATYVLLSHEQWRWGWFAFASGASTAMYMLLYAIYYLCYKTEMTGILQISFYFGYMLMMCGLIALASGAMSYLAVTVFVHRIYNTKHE